jgi:hypothetical protein
MRQELAEFGVSVSMVNPGYINTAIRGKGSPSANSNASLTPVERELCAGGPLSGLGRRAPPRLDRAASLTAGGGRFDRYYERFATLWKKDALHSQLAPACCDETDRDIIHALTDAYPRTRYYPFTASVKLGKAFPAAAAAVIIRAFSVHPLLDRLKDIMIAKLF